MSNKQRNRTHTTGLGSDSPIAGADTLFAVQPTTPQEQTEEVEAKQRQKKQTKRKPKKDISGTGERKKTSFYVLKETHDLLQYMQAKSVIQGDKRTIGHFVEEAVKLYAETHKIKLPRGYKSS